MPRVHEQSWQFRRLAWRWSAAGSAQACRSARRRDLSRLRRTELLFGDNGEVVGVATGDMGVGRDGKPKPNFTRGMELRGKYTLIAEGARGSLAKQLIARVRAGRRPRSAEIRHRPEGAMAGRSGQVPARPGAAHLRLAAHERHRAAARSSTIIDDNLVSVGFVVHSTTQNPTLSPFDEFQRFKTHPLIADTFAGGKRLAYGARAISRGRLAVGPEARFSGRRADRLRRGFVNLPRIKGSHNAILSGMLAAEKVHEALAPGPGPRRTRRLRGCLARLGHRPRPSQGAQRQAAVVALRPDRRHGARRRSTCGPTSLSASRSSAR